MFECLRLLEYGGYSLLIFDGASSVSENNGLNVLTELSLFGLHGFNVCLELFVFSLQLLELLFFRNYSLLFLFPVSFLLLLFIGQ